MRPVIDQTQATSHSERLLYSSSKSFNLDVFIGAELPEYTVDSGQERSVDYFLQVLAEILRVAIGYVLFRGELLTMGRYTNRCTFTFYLYLYYYVRGKSL